MAYQVPVVRLVNQEFEVHKALQDPREQMDHRETLVSRDLLVIWDTQELLVLLVQPASLAPSVCLV